MRQTGCGVKRNRPGVNSGGQEWFPRWFLTPDLLNLGCFSGAAVIEGHKTGTAGSVKAAPELPEPSGLQQKLSCVAL